MSEHYRRGDPEQGCGLMLVLAAGLVFWLVVGFVAWQVLCQ